MGGMLYHSHKMVTVNVLLAMKLMYGDIEKIALNIERQVELSDNSVLLKFKLSVSQVSFLLYCYEAQLPTIELLYVLRDQLPESSALVCCTSERLLPLRNIAPRVLQEVI